LRTVAAQRAQLARNRDADLGNRTFHRRAPETP
jgi:hypothetical protein